MTFNEFKSWLDGFSEAIGDAPTPEQWAKVKAKVGEVANPLGNLQFPQGARAGRWVGDLSPGNAYLGQHAIVNGNIPSAGGN